MIFATIIVEIPFQYSNLLYVAMRTPSCSRTTVDQLRKQFFNFSQLSSEVSVSAGEYMKSLLEQYISISLKILDIGIWREKDDVKDEMKVSEDRVDPVDKLCITLCKSC
ncbi:hypothetical protein FGO68_gene13952 [Halteria grandinella]|uniref:Uncharacterized protein n=1 Tax=Halteria grandinella TaxID=5974 RepID=A0A8J8NGB7_HALGN|nr:hypothetical protein FGO68_gene13952 [Halteria grandinella]